MGPCYWILPIFRQRFLESFLLVICDVFSVTQPNRFLRVEVLPLPNSVRFSPHFRFLLGFFVFVRNFFFFLSFRQRFVLSSGYIPRFGLEPPQLYGERNELTVLLERFLEYTFFELLGSVWLEPETDARASAQGVAPGVFVDRERASSITGPNLLLVVIMLGDDFHFVGH